MDGDHQRTTSRGDFDRADASNEQNDGDESSKKMCEVQVMKQDDVKWDVAAFPQARHSNPFFMPRHKKVAG